MKNNSNNNTKILNIDEYTNKFREDFTRKFNHSLNLNKDFEYLAKRTMSTQDQGLTPRDRVMIDFINYIASKPLQKNDFFKYGQAYFKGAKHKLATKYFRYDTDRLQEIYDKIDTHKAEQKAKDKTPINNYTNNFHKRYVLFMMLIHRGIEFNADEVAVFGCKTKGDREYNPITNSPREVRPMLPIGYEFEQYDIVSAFPTFIDKELGITTRDKPVYDLLRAKFPKENPKKSFAMVVNSHSETKGATIGKLRDKLSAVYGDKVNEVVTEERYATQGKFFEDMIKYEKQAIDKFKEANGLSNSNCIRLHDAILVPKGTLIEHLEQEHIKFNKELLEMPKMREGYSNTFYRTTEDGKIEMNSFLFKDFFIQEKFLRGSKDGVDVVSVFHDTNKVLAPFSKNSEIMHLLSQEINEVDKEYITTRLTTCGTQISKGFELLPPFSVEYYKDGRDEFGVLFNEGNFSYLAPIEDRRGKLLDASHILTKDVMNVKGFFAPSKQQGNEFTPDFGIGEFEQFIMMVRTHRDCTKAEVRDNLTDEDRKLVLSFMTAIGYLSTSYKAPDESYAVILGDEGANGKDREGGRGKTLIDTMLREILTRKKEDGNKFSPEYTHSLNGVNESHGLLFFDEIPANFNFHYLFSFLSGDMVIEPKGKESITIAYKDSPKTLLTTNYVYANTDESTRRRYALYNFKPFFNSRFQPVDVFKKRFFDDWDSAEYNKFYTFIYRCVDAYHKNGLMLDNHDEDALNYIRFVGESKVEDFNYLVTVMEGTSGLVRGRTDEQMKGFYSTKELIDYVRRWRQDSRSRDTELNNHNFKKSFELYVKHNELPVMQSKQRSGRVLWDWRGNINR